MSDIQSRIEVLRLKAGDTIVMHIDVPCLTVTQRDAIRAAAGSLFPVGVQAMILDRGVTLTHIAGDDIEVDLASQSFHFDAWMCDRVERAHRDYMERIRNLPPCDASIEGVARYMGVPI